MISRRDIIGLMHQIWSDANLCLDNFGTLEALNIKIIFRKFFFNMAVGPDRTEVLPRVCVVRKLRKALCLFITELLCLFIT